MKIRTDFVTNSSSSSFYVTISINTHNGKELSCVLESSLADAPYCYLGVNTSPSDLGRCKSIDELVEMLKTAVTYTIWVENEYGDREEETQGVDYIDEDMQNLIAKVSHLSSMNDIETITVEGAWIGVNGGEVITEYTYNRDQDTMSGYDGLEAYDEHLYDNGKENDAENWKEEDLCLCDESCPGGIAFIPCQTKKTDADKQELNEFSIVTFGRCRQKTESGEFRPEPIKWLVLEVDEEKHRALLLSQFGLDAMPYHEEHEDITWERCTLRAWLNNDFLNTAFTPEEQAHILLTQVKNSKKQGCSEWVTDGGKNTEDRIFLLSYAEAKKHLGVKYDEFNRKPRMVPTPYAISQGAYTSSGYKTAGGEYTGWWWLRSPGRCAHGASYVRDGGSLNSIYVDCYDVCVRPAMWVNLESGIFKS